MRSTQSTLESLARPLRVGRVSAADPLDVVARMCWTCVAEPGDGAAGLLVQQLGAGCIFELFAGGRDQVVRDVFAADPVEARSVNWRKSLDTWAPRLDLERILPLLHAATQLDATVLSPGDDLWPTQLDDLGVHAPIGLWVRGNPAHLRPDARSLSLVGSRAATEYGLEAAGELAVAAVTYGLAVVSGGAYGIDAQAHRVALASGGSTVAFMAGGIDRLYPVGNSGVFERMLSGNGTVVSEVPCGQPPTKWRFLHRNRLIAALSPATIVVEAGARSGALNTANHANALGREVGAVPGAITSASSEGCHRLIRAGEATMVSSGDEALELWRSATGGRLFVDGEVDAHPTLLGADDLDGMRLSDAAVRVLDALRPRRGNGEAELAALAGLSIADTRAGLAELELLDRAFQDGTGWRRR
jgi:DNA processing protein